MLNEVTVTANPILLTKKQNTAAWKLRKQIADMDLAAVTASIQRRLSQEIPVRFNAPVKVNLSISIYSFKVKIDYSNIKSPTSIRLIKYYLNNDMHAFAREWIKLA